MNRYILLRTGDRNKIFLSNDLVTGKNFSLFFLETFKLDSTCEIKGNPFYSSVVAFTEQSLE